MSPRGSGSVATARPATEQAALRRYGRRGAWWALLLVASAAHAETEIDNRIAKAQTQVAGLNDEMSLVERSYVARLQSGNEESLQQRFDEAEVGFLIEDYNKASSLLYDVVLSPNFRVNPRYYDGVFYLGESLRHEKDYLGAKRFLRELMDAGPGTPHFQEALVSYLEVAARTNDFRDLDRYADLAERSGRVAPAVQYLVAKSTFERSDLAPSDRWNRALLQFQKVASDSPFYLQSLYFAGVCQVQQGDLDKSREAFARVLAASQPSAPTTDQKAIRELASLAIGRIDYEQGHFSEALDAYQNIPETSPAFDDALYEIAWTYVKKGDYESARKAVELLTLAAPEGSLLPEANLLRGQLLLKLAKYEESEETYQQLVSKYGPVRDQIDQLLAINGDPAAYFDQLLAQKRGSFDVSSLLPAPARGFANSQTEVREAQAVAQDLGDGRQGIRDSDVIVARIRERLQQAADLEAFPALQAGYQRASTVDAAALQTETTLVALAQQVLSKELTPGEQAELQELTRQRADLAKQFASLPKNDVQLEGRSQQRLAQLRQQEKAIFKLSLLVQSLRAEGVAVQKSAGEVPSGDTGDRQKFNGEVAQVLAEADAYDSQLSDMTKALRDQEAVDTGIGGRRDEGLRNAYATALQREADLLSRVRQRAAPAAQVQVDHLQALREQLAQLRSRAGTAMEAIRQAAVVQAEVIRQKLALESSNLDDYRAQVTTEEGSASGLVGRIAYQSFKRVRRQVYDLVLKADVGIVDVAWTRKRNDGEKIQKLASDKDRELRTLDEDFREVLEEVH